MTFININSTIEKEVRKSGVWLPSQLTYESEVVYMVDILLQLIILLFSALVAVSIITFALIIALVIIKANKTNTHLCLLVVMCILHKHWQPHFVAPNFY